MPTEETTNERLARLDERVKVIEKKVGNGDDPLFVTHQEFSPIRALVYGFVGMILTGIIAALLALVINHGK